MSAEDFKQKGNQALQSGNAAEAIKFYTEGLKIDPNNHILYSNRSAAYAKINRFNDSINDANKVIEINPQFWKGYSRKGNALIGLRKFEDALKTFQEGLNACPDTPQLQQGLQQAFQMHQETVASSKIAKLFDGDVVARAKGYPECASFADTPAFKEKIKQIQQNPSIAFVYAQSDPQIQTYLSVAMQREGLLSEMGINEEELAKKQAEEEEKQRRYEQERRDRELAEKKRREQEEKRRKEEEKLASMTEEQKQADKIKEQANQLFKNKKYDESLELYQKAHELDPKDMTFKSNISAVLFAQKKYDECLKLCEEALVIGRENRASGDLKARCYTRMGNCYFKKGEFDTSMEYYDKSLLEKYDKKVLQLKKKAEKAKYAKEKEDYINPELSEKAKLEGNELFKQGKFPEAVKRYTEAIKRNPENVACYTNRATAYTKLGALPNAIKDCDQAIELDKTFIKAYIKKANAYFIMRKYAESISTYEEALKYDPENEEIKAGIQKTMYQVNSTQLTEEEVKQNIENNPEVQEILRDPGMQQILRDFERNPEAARHHLQNPMIRQNLLKLQAVGFLRGLYLY